MGLDPIDFTHATPHMRAHGAFVNTENGKTYGHTSCERWSPSTLQKLAELRAAIEGDLARLVLEDVDNERGTEHPTRPAGGIFERLEQPTDAEPL